MRKPTKKQITAKMQLKSLTPVYTRGELIQARAKQLEAGEITALDLANELQLTPEQFKYCQYYTSTEHLADSFTSAVEAYDMNINDPKIVSKVNAIIKRLDSHQAVQTMINALLNTAGFTEANANVPAPYKLDSFLKIV